MIDSLIQHLVTLCWIECVTLHMLGFAHGAGFFPLIKFICGNSKTRQNGPVRSTQPILLIFWIPGSCNIFSIVIPDSNSNFDKS